MGANFSNIDGVDDRSGEHNQRAPAPSTANMNDEEEDLFWTRRPVQDQSRGGEEEEEDLFWTWRPVQDQSSGGEEEEVDLFWTWRAGQDEKDHQDTDVTDDETSEQNVTTELPEDQETPTSDTEIITTPDPVPIESECKEELALDWDEKIQPVLVNLAEMKMEDDDEEMDYEASADFLNTNTCQYKIGEILAEGSTVRIYEATRMLDGLKVAVKCVYGRKHMDYISIPDYPVPLPRELALHMLACGGTWVREIVHLLDWQVYPDRYFMVLEYPTPCMDLQDFLASNGGKLNEDTTKDIMWQASMAAYVCCRKGVFHRDITMENLLVTTDHLNVKLIDFGCSDVLQMSPYRTFIGTRDYACPEFFKTGEYYGPPATVYSLGTLLFALLCGTYPNCNDQYAINERFWSRDNLTEECCDFIEACLQEDPGKRMNLEKILEHKWFQDKYPTCGLQIQKPNVKIAEINGCQYEIGTKMGQGGFGAVYEGTRLHDGLKVAVKYVKKDGEVGNDYINISGHPEPLPREVGLQMLACQGESRPVIIQFLDWQDFQDHYLMVLERPSPCMDVDKFVEKRGGTISEFEAQYIMGQATEAAEICCERKVFHRDIKMENLLINPDTFEVKLIDFGCGALLKDSTYKEFMGTFMYCCPEYIQWEEYYAKPATVYSLGVLLFVMLCGRFPLSSDLYQINRKTWRRDGLTEECCDLIRACLQEDPDERIPLEEILLHEWFQGENHIDIEGIQEIDGCQYNVGKQIGEGGFGTVFKGTRMEDGLEVAVKLVKKEGDVLDDYINISGHAEPLPREVGLQMLACRGEHFPMIIQFLGWQDYQNYYLMVLERPSPCMDVDDFLKLKGGRVTEAIAQDIFEQVAEAAEVCCRRRVFHRDIKPQNLLINPNTMDVKLIDFGCGALMKKSAYTEYMGTRIYTCPEYYKNDGYHAKPATVYSLGVLLFVMVCGRYPNPEDTKRISEWVWYIDGLTEECCELIQACLQEGPDERIPLEKISYHKWFQMEDPK